MKRERLTIILFLLSGAVILALDSCTTMTKGLISRKDRVVYLEDELPGIGADAAHPAHCVMYYDKKLKAMRLVLDTAIAIITVQELHDSLRINLEQVSLLTHEAMHSQEALFRAYGQLGKVSAYQEMWHRLGGHDASTPLGLFRSFGTRDSARAEWLVH